MRRLRGAAELALVAGCVLAVVVVLQCRLGAYSSDFNADESSHYVSGLLIHDYLAAGFPGSPLAFLRRFHSSYPLVGIGHWGPFYYAVEGLWMLLFGWGRTATILLSGCVTTGVALLLYWLAAPRFGRVLAAAIALVFAASPVIQVGSDAVMLDGGITLLSVLCVLAYARYLRTGSPAWSLVFGALAAAALLIKGNAAALALLPPFALAIGREWRRLRRWSFWLPAIVVVVVVGPYYWLTYGQVAAGFRYHWGWQFSSVAVPGNVRILLRGVGLPLFAAGAAGWLMVCRRPPLGAEGRLLVAAASLLAAVFVFQSVAPADIQDRYLAPALPPLLLLAGFAVAHVAARWPGFRRSRGPWLVAGVFCLGLFPGVLDVAPKPRFGMIEAARQVWAARVPDNPSVLVVADGAAEGAAIAELAMRDPARPSLFVVRGSRLLGGGGFNTHDYVPRFRTPAEVIGALDAYAIPLVLVRSDPGHDLWTHIGQVEQARALQPGRWKLLFSGEQGGVPVELYRLCDNAARRADAGRLEALSAPRSLGDAGVPAGGAAPRP